MAGLTHDCALNSFLAFLNFDIVPCTQQNYRGTKNQCPRPQDSRREVSDNGRGTILDLLLYVGNFYSAVSLLGAYRSSCYFKELGPPVGAAIDMEMTKFPRWYYERPLLAPYGPVT